MLHSKDTDINKIIRDIIELDSKAVRIKNKVVARGDDIIDEVKEQIKKTEEIEIKNAKLVAEESYKIQIELAEKERDKIIADMKENIKKTYCRYNEKKNKQAEEVIETLFN